ncbi:XkdX family protein [Ornithinibacillus bavariensis]|uniref:XkdX family protein n=1 Tax=Ornithinibacillus bavariensis TaxID=545502 RepID=A0A920C7I9_9BACI|nr:XkdX family protein [Ornithinibacillus bavariensis]GIO27718.1 hypothetical protein J43TS3_23290 [Ornithinibacillus bavariensis]
MTEFEKWRDRYIKHWTTKIQLRTLVGLEVLTADEYKDMTGEEYSDETN